MVQQKKSKEVLAELLKKYNIPNKESSDGTTKINGMAVNAYFDNIVSHDNSIYESINMHCADVPSAELVYGSIEATTSLYDLETTQDNDMYEALDILLLAA